MSSIARLPEPQNEPVRSYAPGSPERGSLEALRHGFGFYGQKVRLAFFKPGSRKNPELWIKLINHELRAAMRSPRGFDVSKSTT